MKIERDVQTTVRLGGEVKNIEPEDDEHEWLSLVWIMSDSGLVGSACSKWHAYFPTEAEAEAALKEQMDRIERELGCHNGARNARGQ